MQCLRDSNLLVSAVAAYSCQLNLSRINYRVLPAHPRKWLRSERLCINYIKNYFKLPKFNQNNTIFDLSKVSKLSIIIDLLKRRKIASSRIFIYPVTEGLQTSNFRSRYSSLKGFHRPLH